MLFFFQSDYDKIFQMRTWRRCRCHPYRPWLSIILPPSEFWSTSEEFRQKATLPVSEQTCRTYRAAIILHYELADGTSIIYGDIRFSFGHSFYLKWPTTFLLSYLSVRNSSASVAFVRSSSVIEARLDRPSSLANFDIKPKIVSSCFWRNIIRSWFNASATSCHFSFQWLYFPPTLVVSSIPNIFDSNRFSKIRFYVVKIGDKFRLQRIVLSCCYIFIVVREKSHIDFPIKILWKTSTLIITDLLPVTFLFNQCVTDLKFWGLVLEIQTLREY